jgi:hypothetical protein
VQSIGDRVNDRVTDRVNNTVNETAFVCPVSVTFCERDDFSVPVDAGACLSDVVGRFVLVEFTAQDKPCAVALTAQTRAQTL